MENHFDLSIMSEWAMVCVIICAETKLVSIEKLAQ